MKRILFILILGLLICAGCSWHKQKEEKTAKELCYEGMHQFDKGNYLYSIEFFEKIKDWYPFSDLATVAELKIADAHYHLENYDEAVLAYREFENLHPNNEKIPYVLYQIGQCYLEQMSTIDRDQTPAKKTLHAFRRLFEQYPESIYASKAEENIRKCLKSLAGHDFYVGLFYYKTRNYKAALYRFKSIISNYPDVGVHKKAMEYISLCKAHIKEKKELKKGL